MEVAGERRGVLLACSGTPDFFDEDDLAFLEATAHWIGQVIHRTELVQDRVELAELRGRREATAGLLNRQTPRQREIAALIAGGLSNDEIAERLVLTPGTAGNHVVHLLRRLGARSRVEVAALATEAGLRRQHPE